VPVVTYGFDQSFLDFFGTNGVAAVQSAIQIINDLPPASNLVLTNFPFYTYKINGAAQVKGLFDLKSHTLSLLVEHLGLAQPVRNIRAIKQWGLCLTPSYYGYPENEYLPISMWADWVIPEFIVLRNFDPQTLTGSSYVNNTLYAAYVYSSKNSHQVVQYAVYSFDDYIAVADYNILSGGEFFAGLTYDDAGGIGYLLSTNTVQYETLLPGITGIGASSNPFVNGAWRPGVNKITFVPQSVDALPGTFLSMTNQFTDTYITNGHIIQQQVQRVITQPDFLFTALDTGKDDVDTPFSWRTGTTNWINNASANGNTNGEGPGVIQPPVQIGFHKLGFFKFTFGGQNEDENEGGVEWPWASFDDSTNVPIIYPIPQTGTNQMMVRMWLERGAYPTLSTTCFEWSPISAIGTPFVFETSTNLQSWVKLFTVTNNGTVSTYENYNPASPSRFYRLVPQP
jgi:hypothetical protein